MVFVSWVAAGTGATDAVVIAALPSEVVVAAAAVVVGPEAVPSISD